MHSRRLLVFNRLCFAEFENKSFTEIVQVYTATETRKGVHCECIFLNWLNCKKTFICIFAHIFCGIHLIYLQTDDCHTNLSKHAHLLALFEGVAEQGKNSSFKRNSISVVLAAKPEITFCVFSILCKTLAKYCFDVWSKFLAAAT